MAISAQLRGYRLCWFRNCNSAYVCRLADRRGRITASWFLLAGGKLMLLRAVQFLPVEIVAARRSMASRTQN